MNNGTLYGDLFLLKVFEWLVTPLRRKGYSVKQNHTDKFEHLEKVSYSDLRDHIHNGDLLFCGGNYTFSKVIRYLSGRSQVSHVGVVYWWNDRLMLMESVETDGVRIVPVSQYVKNYENSGKGYNGRIYLARDKRLHIPPAGETAAASSLRNPKVEQLLNFAATLLNKKFSFWDVWLFFWQGSTGREYHKNDDQFLCSEFVAACFAHVGISYPDDGRGFIAPEHIAMSDDITALVEIRSGQGN